ncbi:MASE1 domain-containing protein [Roseovarius pelagicus]|uniref:histidine kinase n=1 Tax=Roseovarius pelagicus TaxID=2980108 RepID=A0ABY6DLX3_9RHOB|nr:MASE1 domain-containing protein [Roseovarius pelagicus]UXX84770.1 MASE1 domain-containing protein [Roseovarius pelagicus]
MIALSHSKSKVLVSTDIASETVENDWPITRSGSRVVLTSERPSGIALGACYAAYMLAAVFGQWMSVIPGIPITVWPPNGVILAVLIITPRRSWHWWIAIGAAGELTGNVLWFHNNLIPALGYVLGNAAAVVTAALLLAPHLGHPLIRLTSLRQVFAFLFIGVLTTPVISATIGSAIDAAVGKNPFVVTWPLWWLGDATGILIASPLVISTVNAWREAVRPNFSQLLEAAGIAATIVAISVWELSTGAAHAFLLLIPVIWAALRFEFRGTALTILTLALVVGTHTQTLATTALAANDAVFAQSRLQILIAAAAATGLIVAGLIRQQREVLIDLARINAELEDRVARRARTIEAAEARFKATFENAAVAIGIVDAQGKLVRVNESFARMLGYDVNALEGFELDRFTHPDDRTKGTAAWRQLASGDSDQYELEKRYLRKDGETVWGHTSVSCVRTLSGGIDYGIKIIQDITARKQSDEARQILAREVNHRSKNLIAIIQAIARRTSARSPEDFATTFAQRLQSLAANQDLLIRSDWESVGLKELVCSQIEPLGTVGERFVLSGPPITVSSAAAQAIGMALHELATNAAKYGSLSSDQGKVEIDWTVDGDDFRMSWTETGGPEAKEPDQHGFGTTVIDTMISSTLSAKVTIDYTPKGLVWRLCCPHSALSEAG